MSLRPAVACLATPLALALCPAAPAQDGGLSERDALLGDLFGLRSGLGESGVTVDLTLVVDGTQVVSGGAARNEAVRGLFDVAVAADMAALAGIEGAVLFLDAYSLFGEQDSGAGNIQGVSNIDAEVRDQIAELWWEQLFLDDRLRVKVGKVEANSEFAWVEYGGELIGPAWAISPNVLGIPTYPETAVSFNAEWTPDDRHWVRVGVYDGAAQSGRRTGVHGVGSVFGAPSDLWLALEVGRTWNAGRLGVGAWRATGDFDEFSGGVADGSNGFYAVFDQTLAQEVDAAGEPLSSTGLFARLAYADPEVSEVELHLATGVQWTGLLAARPSDVCGCGVSIAELSSEAGFDDDREVVLEGYWGFQVTPAIALKPDVQYIVDPGGDPLLDDALVLGLRVQAAF